MVRTAEQTTRNYDRALARDSLNHVRRYLLSEIERTKNIMSQLDLSDQDRAEAIDTLDKAEKALMALEMGIYKLEKHIPEETLPAR
jgi:hypothetical protein